ncbi:MAG TPA: histidine--tRNA ligase [Candidatus Limnocylindria bacterium]|nr:histidine--tRNA ligase [Candidatus Limnocylindria bacterium]
MGGQASFAAVKGFRDVLPNESRLWRKLEGTAAEVFARYDFHPIVLPMLERAELFARTLGEGTDVVEKEMYTFEDRDGAMLTLRPEATASAVRAYLDSGLGAQAQVARFWYAGPMFRRERPQRGRYRQFHQIGVEAFGQAEPIVDGEILVMLMHLLASVGVRDVCLHVGSLGDAACRPAYRERLAVFARERLARLCGDCHRRLTNNPLRLLDCKVPGCREALADAPVMLDHLCGPCGEHFTAVCRLLDGEGVAYTLAPRLVRGLDYYNRTAFEVTAAGLGAQDAVAGGGRYDGLVAALGGPDVPAFGFAIGLERLALAAGGELAAPAPSMAVLPLLAEAAAPALAVATRMRAGGLTVLLEPPGRSLKALLRSANRRQARAALLLGGDELAAGRGTVRDLVRGIDHRLALPLDAASDELVRWVREHEEGGGPG